MDPPLDPPPLAAQPTAAVPAVAVAVTGAAVPPAAATANATPALPTGHNHPPYAEMITAAITALKERDGSSKRAIAKYIESQYSDLPPTHSALLTHHLKRLKTNGQLLMVKKSYKLPTRSNAAAVNGAVNAGSSDPSSSGPKRRPGRPPKPKPDAIQAAVPVFAAPINMNAEPAAAPEAPPPDNVAVGPVNGGAVRGRGRPPKRGRGRPPKSGGDGGASTGGSVGRGRGRPSRNAAVAPTAPREKGPGRPRGRPPKPINVVEGLAPVQPGIPAVPVAVGAPVMAGKRRGRPPKVGGGAVDNPRAQQPKKLRRLSGKPLGRPRKTNEAPESQLVVAYLAEKGKIKALNTAIQEAAKLIRPLLNNEAALNALQELEQAGREAADPPTNQNPQPPPEQPQPQS